MLGLETLDIAIGMVFVYLLLSLICSALNELIEAKLGKRATDLERGIRALLSDENRLKELYRHPLIFGLYEGEYGGKATKLPTYIPARTFALALMDTVLTAGPNTASGARGATAPSASALNAASQFQQLRGAVEGIQEDRLRGALLTLVDAAGNDVSRVRENIEDWFNSSMDRVSGWYKRRAQIIILVLGFVVTIATNADTVAIVNSLVQDRALRDSLVAASQEYARRPAESQGNAQELIKENTERIKALGLPVGWDTQDPRVWPGDDGVRWLFKIFGWFLTAMAISLGAPFWFDLLNKFMVIRSTVKPHEKSPEEASEDRQLPPTQPRAPDAGASPVGPPAAGGPTFAAAAAAPSAGAFQPNEWAAGDAQEGIV